MAGNRWRRLAAVVGATALALMIVPLSGEAATPGSGTMTPPAEPVCTSTPSPPPVQCDQFDLTLKLPAGYWAAKAGKAAGYLEVTIDWSDQPSATSQDIDLLVNNSTGKQVGSGETDNISNKTSHETARVLEPAGGV